MSHKIQLTQDEIDECLEILQKTLQGLRLHILGQAGKSSYTDKQDGSPVTDTDVAVEEALQRALTHKFPNIPVFGEETGYDDDQSGTFWLVDPIDGTQSFVENVPTFTSMAVLIQDEVAVASLIYNISRDEMYVARRGQGAYKDGRRLDLALVSLPQTALCKDDFIPILDQILEPAGVKCEKAPTGGGYGFTMVADGITAARFNIRSRGYIHDYAPGALLVREAGGRLVPVKDKTYTYRSRSFVACHPALESLLRSQLERIRTLER